MVLNIFTRHVRSTERPELWRSHRENDDFQFDVKENDSDKMDSMAAFNAVIL